MIIFKDQLTEQLTRTGQAENLLKKKKIKLGMQRHLGNIQEIGIIK